MSSGRGGYQGSGSSRGNLENEYDPLYTYPPNAFSDFDPFFNNEPPMEMEPEPEPELPQTQSQTQESVHDTTGSNRPRTTNVWEHFTKIRKENGAPNEFKVQCKYCNRKPYEFKSGGGYGTFRKHLKDKHPDKEGIATSQRQISSYGTGEIAFRFDLQVYKEELARFISVEHLSFRFAEKIGLINFLQRGVNPQARRISRTTIRRTIEDLYGKEKKSLISYFKSFNSSVHICSDVWSDHWRMHSYMGITCHWIDSEWVMQKRIIAFRVFDTNHTAHNIAMLIKNILDEYSLINSVFSIGFDNASSNTASLPELIKVCKPTFGGKYFHVRCSCHVLNLCVQSGLKVLDVFISAIKSAVQFLWRNPSEMRAWGEYCRQHEKKARRFSRDVPTRWNSTYILLNETMNYRTLLIGFFSKYHADLELQLYESTWDICKKILDVLEVFNDATFTLSGVYYPTTHLFFVEAINIAGALDVPPFVPIEGEEEQKANNRRLLSCAMEVMREKWVAYYKDIPILYLVACVFDPRTKIEGLNDYLVTYYSCLHMCDYINIRKIIDDVKKHVVDLYNEYSNRCGASFTSSSSNVSTESKKSTSSSKGWHLLWSRQKKSKGVVGNISELDGYLNVQFEFSDEEHINLDILDWWKRHAIQYPILAMIAKQILATPCSTVAVEQAFSAGGNILDESRSRLLPDCLEFQTCLDDWTRAKNRQQEIDRASYQFFDDDDGNTTTTATEN